MPKMFKPKSLSSRAREQYNTSTLPLKSLESPEPLKSSQEQESKISRQTTTKEGIIIYESAPIMIPPPKPRFYIPGSFPLVDISPKEIEAHNYYNCKFTP